MEEKTKLLGIIYTLKNKGYEFEKSYNFSSSIEDMESDLKEIKKTHPKLFNGLRW